MYKTSNHWSCVYIFRENVVANFDEKNLVEESSFGTSDIYVGAFNSGEHLETAVVYHDSNSEFQSDIKPSNQITFVNCFDDEIIDEPSQTDSEIGFQQDQTDISSMINNQMDNADPQYNFIPDAQNTITVPCNCKGDNLDKFFDSIASTIRQFPPLEIAQAKVAISNIVGAMEVQLLKKTAAGNQLGAPKSG